MVEHVTRQRQDFSHKGQKYRAEPEIPLGASQLLDPFWRLNNLYKVKDEHGQLVTFKLRPLQDAMLRHPAKRKVLCKARQIGSTTTNILRGLDLCLFTPNTEMVVIAHRKETAAKLLEEKVKVPYFNLDPAIKQMVQLVSDNATRVVFSNGSAITVSTSGRGGTCQYLLISEFGFTSKYRPDVAREIQLGSIPSVHAGGIVVVESTAEGSGGRFADIYKRASDREKQGIPATDLDFVPLFYAWYEQASYTLPERDIPHVHISDRLVRYFRWVEAECQIVLTDGQKAWYARQESELGDDMKQEFPSTADEAFLASGEGHYFATQMSDAREQGRLLESMPKQPHKPVYASFDIGVDDPAAAVLFREAENGFYDVIGYYEDTEEGLGHHVAEIRAMAEEQNWQLAKPFIGPHDMDQRRGWRGKSTADEAAEYGAAFHVIKVVANKGISISSARRFINRVRFDLSGPGVERLVEVLDNYARKWMSATQTYAESPRHDEYSHGSDAFQGAAMFVDQGGYEGIAQGKAQVDPRHDAAGYGATGAAHQGISLSDYSI